MRGAMATELEPEPETISWLQALNRITEAGHDKGTALEMLLNAVIGGAIGWYSRKAVSLQNYLDKGLFDPETGALRMSHRDDNPFWVKPILADFQQWLALQRPESAKSADEKTAISYVAGLLRQDTELTRGDALDSARKEYPNRTLSERGFKFRIWPAAREPAGLKRRAPPGAKPKQ